jgi:hypothetical protein
VSCCDFWRGRFVDGSGSKWARGEIYVQVPRGGAMVMKPLLLHASSKASISGMRRVLHFVFGAAELPGGLRWPDTRCSALIERAATRPAHPFEQEVIHPSGAVLHDGTVVDW